MGQFNIRISGRKVKESRKEMSPIYARGLKELEMYKLTVLNT